MTEKMLTYCNMHLWLSSCPVWVILMPVITQFHISI